MAKTKKNTKKRVNQPSKFALLALEMAKEELGKKEAGLHYGPEILPFQKAARNISGGLPWDMSLIYFCVDNAAKKLKQHNPLAATHSPCQQLKYVLREAYNIHQAYYETSRKVSVLDTDEVDLELNMLRPGDIFLTQFSQGNWHSGFIDKVGKEIITIEGCIAAGANREVGVFNKRRDIKQIKKIIRLE